MKKSLLGTAVLSMGLLCAAPLWAAPVTPPKPAKTSKPASRPIN